MIPIGCVLCDWAFDLTAAPLAVYRPGGQLPLCWRPTGPEPVLPSEVVAETAEAVALVHHWHAEHPALLRLVLGDYDVDSVPRSH